MASLIPIISIMGVEQRDQFGCFINIILPNWGSDTPLAQCYETPLL